jgi:hypothetical protein
MRAAAPAGRLDERLEISSLSTSPTAGGAARVGHL